MELDASVSPSRTAPPPDDSALNPDALPSITSELQHFAIQPPLEAPGDRHSQSYPPMARGVVSTREHDTDNSPLTDVPPVDTPCNLVPPCSALPYDGDKDLEKAINMAMKNKDTAAWKLLIKARTLRNNLSSAGGPSGFEDLQGASTVAGVRCVNELRRAAVNLGWTDNEINWAQAKAEGDFVEGIKLLLREEVSAPHLNSEGAEGDQREEGGDDQRHRQQHQHPRQPLDPESAEAVVTSSILRRLSIDSTWQLLQSTQRAPGDEAARRKAWMENALILVQVSSLQRQGRLSMAVKKKMKSAIAHGLGREVNYLLRMMQQQQIRQHRDSVDREDSLFISYKCPLTDDLLYEPVTLVCGHTFSKRALEGVLSCGNRKCPICRGPISVADADELKVNILMRDTITRLFSDRILQLVRRDIALLRPGNIELAAEELYFIIERYKANEDIIDLAVHTLLTWTLDKKNLATLSRRGLGREVLTLLRVPAFRASAKFQRRTAGACLQILHAFGSGSAHGAKMLSESGVWATALSLLFDKLKVRGSELAALATEVFKLVALVVKSNQESAAMQLEPPALAHQVLEFVHAHRQEASMNMVTASFHLIKRLIMLAHIKGSKESTLKTMDARQVLALWSVWSRTSPCKDKTSPLAQTVPPRVGGGNEAMPMWGPEVVREGASLLSTAIFLQRNNEDFDEHLTSVLVDAGAVEIGLDALERFPHDTDVLLSVVPLLLRLGFSSAEEANVIHEEVCMKLKAPLFLNGIERYLAGLEEKAQYDELPEDPIVFEKSSSSRIDIQEDGAQVMANGKGWVIGSVIAAGTLVLTYEILQEDEGDECSCLGISLASDPPATAEYRSTGSPFITLRCFSGEVYRDTRVVHASEAMKVHPGGIVRVSVDLEAGSLSFQVNDSLPVLIASDLKGCLIYPAAYFYLGEAQPDRSTHPIIRMSTTGSQTTKALAVAMDSALDFTFPVLLPTADIGRKSGDTNGSSTLRSLLYQEGRIVRRRASDFITSAAIGGSRDRSTRIHLMDLLGYSASRAYCYGVGPGVSTGVHTYVFKPSPGLSVCFGMVASDAVEPVFRLRPTSPGTIQTSMLVCIWSTGRIACVGLPEGLQPIRYDGEDIVKMEEPITVRVRLEGDDKMLEVIRGARVIHMLDHLDRRLPNGQALHPFVGLLSAKDSIGIEYRVSSPVHVFGYNDIPARKAWTLKAQVVLQEMSILRHRSRSICMDPPTCLSLSALFQYLDEPTGPYRPVLVLEELKRRAMSGGLGAEAVMNIVCNICRSAARNINWDGNDREKAVWSLVSLMRGANEQTCVVSSDTNGGSGGDKCKKDVLVRTGALKLIVMHCQDGFTAGGFELLASILGTPPCSAILQAYAQEIGVFPLLLATMDRNVHSRQTFPNCDNHQTGPAKENNVDPDRALDLLLLLLQGPGAPVEAVRREFLSLGLYHVLIKKVITRLFNTLPARRAMRDTTFGTLLRLLAGEGYNQKKLMHEILQIGAAMTAANPFLIQLHELTPETDRAVDEIGMMVGAVSELSGQALQPAISGPSISSGPVDLSLPRHNVSELQEGWRGYVSRSGVASTCWQDAAFWALMDGDIDMLRVLLAVPHFVPFIADRVAFAPAWPGPWEDFISKPATMLDTLEELAAHNHIPQVEYVKAFLVAKAKASRQQSCDNLDNTSSGTTQTPSAFLQHPYADGTLGIFCVETRATQPFGFLHNDLVVSAEAPEWGYARVLGTQGGRLWLQFQGCPGALTCPQLGWGPFDLRLVRAYRDMSSCGASTTFRLPLERGTRVVRGPNWEWGTQDAFAGNVGTVLGSGGGDGWYRVMWETTHTSNSYQYTLEHQDISRFNDPMENPFSTLFPALSEGLSTYVDESHSPGESAKACDDTANVVPFIAEALSEAGMDALLDRLCDLWSLVEIMEREGRQESKDQRTMLLACLASLGMRSPGRMAKIYEHSLARILVKEALIRLEDACFGCGHLFFLAAVCRSGPDDALNRLLQPSYHLIARLLHSLLSRKSSIDATCMSIFVLDTLICRREDVVLREISTTLRESGPGFVHGILTACLERILSSKECFYAAAHVLALRVIRRVYRVQADLLQPSDEEKGKFAQLQERFRGLLDTYATYASSKVVVEELLRLLLDWIKTDAATSGSDYAKRQCARVKILARALLDECEEVNETLLRAPRQVILEAPNILRHALRARNDMALRKRSVNLLLRAGTLRILYQGDYAWTGPEVQHLTSLCSLLDELVISAPERTYHIVPLPLMRALLHVLSNTTDTAAVKAILQVYEYRLRVRENNTKGIFEATVCNGHGDNDSRNVREGGNRAVSNNGRGTSHDNVGHEAFWTTLGPSLAHALCVSYSRLSDDVTSRVLALKILASVVQETGVLEQKDVEILLSSPPWIIEDVKALGIELKKFENGSTKTTKRAEDNVSALLIASKLRIIAMACRSFEMQVQINMRALVKQTVEWLKLNMKSKLVIEVALQLLLSLIDDVHVLLPRESFLSSGRRSTNSLFVQQNFSSKFLKSMDQSSRFPSPRPVSLVRGYQNGIPLSGERRQGREHHFPEPSQVTEALGDGIDNDEDDEGDSELGGSAEDEEHDRGDILRNEDMRGETNSSSGYYPHSQPVRRGVDQVDGGGREWAVGAAGRGEDIGDSTVQSDDDVENQDMLEAREEVALSSTSLCGKPGWEPSGAQLPHWVQVHLPRSEEPYQNSTVGEQHLSASKRDKQVRFQKWRAIELELRDYQHHTPQVLEVSAGRLPPGASLPLPANSLRGIRIIEQSNHRQTGWLSLVEDDDLTEEENVVQILISRNFGPDEVSSKTGHFRMLARTRTGLEEIKAELEKAAVRPLLLRTALANEKDRSFLRIVTLFFRRFYPVYVESLPALANSEYDLRRGQAAGLSFSEDGKHATFPFGPKLLVSVLNSSDNILRWVFRSSGNSSWAVGAIPASKIDRHDLMMAEQTLAVATTGLAGGRITLRKQIQSKKLEAVIDAHAKTFILTVEDDRDYPIVLPLPSESQEAFHLALMGYSNTTITFLDEL